MLPAEKVKPRRAWIAALLSLLTPGLGHVYAGSPRRGATALAALWSAAALWIALSLGIDLPLVRIALFAMVVGFWGWIVLDAVRAARAVGPEYAARRYNQPLMYVGIALIVAYVLYPAFEALVSGSVGRAYAFPSGSMSPTIQAGDYLFVSPRPPNPIARGDLLVWQDPDGALFIQRAAGLPGDTVEMRRKVLHVNGEPLSEPYVRHTDPGVGSSRVDLQACKLEYSIVSPK